MIIKNYCTPKGQISTAADLQIIEDVTDVFVYACCFGAESIGTGLGDGSGPTTFYGTENQSINKLTRHIDFTRHGIKCRLVVTDHAYICNDEGRTVEKVSA